MASNGLNNHLWIVRRLEAKYRFLTKRASPREALEDLYAMSTAGLCDAELAIEEGRRQNYENPAKVSAGMSTKIEYLVELSVLDQFSAHLSSFEGFFDGSSEGADTDWIPEPSTMDGYILEKTRLSSMARLVLAGHLLAAEMDIDSIRRHIVPDMEEKIPNLRSEISELETYIGQLEGVERGQAFREELQARRLEKYKARTALRFAIISLKRAHCQHQVMLLRDLALDYPRELIDKVKEIRDTIESYRSLHEDTRGNFERVSTTIELACDTEHDDTQIYMMGKAFKAREAGRCLIAINEATAQLGEKIAALEAQPLATEAAAAASVAEDSSMS